MASGTVGYTDTRGNRDYSSIIANQIGKRLKEASNMASEERAYAAGMAEAGGTSLEEAGIGKGYFFGRALGSRFGGDKIARTKGRMGMGGAGTNPNATPAQRFRGGFDYKVTNEISNLTDTTPISNALVTGLRGVQGGLISVSQAIARQDRSLGELANTQADMAKAIMFNGYLFQMFASQQRQEAGRRSARREEASIEGRGFNKSRGIIGGSFYGGAGGGRGMINVTPSGGSGGGGVGGVGGRRIGAPGIADTLSTITSLGTNPQSIRLLRRAGLLTTANTGLTASEVLIGSGAQAAGKLGTEYLQNPRNFGSAMSKLLGGNIDSSLFEGMAKTYVSPDGVIKSIGNASMMSALGVETADDATKLAVRMGLESQLKQGELFEYFETFKRTDAAKGLGNATMVGDTVRDALVFSKLTDSKGVKLYTKDQVKMFEALGLSPGAANVARFDKRLAKVGGDISKIKSMRNAGISAGGFAENIAKFFPEAKSFKNLEQAVVLTEFAKLIDAGMKPKDAVKSLRQVFGSKVADKVLIQGGDILNASKSATAGALKKFGQKGALARIGKALPGVGAVLGTAFAINRLRQGDLLGAGLEFGSGLLGLMPGLGTKAGLAIDGYLIARDMGLTPLNTGGRLSGFPVNSFLSVNGRPLASFNEPGNPESIQIVKDDKDTPIEQGKGIVEGMLKKKNDYAALTGLGVERGLNALSSEGFFSGLLNTTKNVTNTLTSPFKSMKNWFMKGFTPAENSMSWKDLFTDDWMQRQRTGGPGKGGWNPFRGMPGYGTIRNFLTGKPGNEIPGGFQTGPTPLGRQALFRGFNLLKNPKAAIIASLLTPSEMGDGTLTGNMDYLNSLGVDTSNLQGVSSMGGAANATVINNTYNNYNGPAGGDNTSGDEVVGQSFNNDLEKFITNFSIMSK